MAPLDKPGKLFFICSSLAFQGDILTMSGCRTTALAALAISATALLSACDNGPSAVTKQAAGTQMAAAERPASSAAQAPGVDHRKDPVALVDGKPVWSASRRYSADEGAQRAFERNGEAFGARTRDQYVKKAHAFVEHPPKGTLTLTRANGDTLFYDPSANVFAVANKDGAPRAMFKPDDGMAYWEKQKDRESRRQTARRSSSRDDEA
jgi:pyocin large subunit-like protein